MGSEPKQDLRMMEEINQERIGSGGGGRLEGGTRHSPNTTKSSLNVVIVVLMQVASYIYVEPQQIKLIPFVLVLALDNPLVDLRICPGSSLPCLYDRGI
jgi:hypothetical protein